MIKAALAKVLSVKAAAVLAGLSAGGVVLAAGTGALPSPFGHSPSQAPSVHASDEPGNGPAGANATPSPSLVGLCHAFRAGAGADRGKALESPAFRVLITTAGGKDNVDAYCTELLSSSGPAPAERPGEQRMPHPTGTPAHPTGAATSQPG